MCVHRNSRCKCIRPACDKHVRYILCLMGTVGACWLESSLFGVAASNVFTVDS